MSKFIFYYGVKTSDDTFVHEIIGATSDSRSSLEKWLKLFKEFSKIIKITKEDFNNEKSM